MSWKQERLKAVAMSCPSRTQVEFIRPMNFRVCSSDLKCDKDHDGPHVALNPPSKHTPVNGLENVPRWEAKRLLVLVLALPAWTEDREPGGHVLGQTVLGGRRLFWWSRAYLTASVMLFQSG